MDLILKIEDLADYLVKHGLINTSEEFVDNFRQKSEDIIKKIIYISRGKFLQDGRVFQLYAFDFIIDQDLNLWLVDIKINPMYSLKNKDLVEKVLERQFKVLNHRSNFIYEFFHETKNTVDKLIYDEEIEIKSKDFEKDLLSIVYIKINQFFW